MESREGIGVNDLIIRVFYLAKFDALAFLPGGVVPYR